MLQRSSIIALGNVDTGSMENKIRTWEVNVEMLWDICYIYTVQFSHRVVNGMEYEMGYTIPKFFQDHTDTIFNKSNRLAENHFKQQLD